MITIHIDVEGLRESQGAFAKLETRLTRLKPLMEQFGQEFYEQETSLFDRQPWTPLSPAYAIRKQKVYGDKPILRATDRLFLSLTKQGSEGNVHRTTDTGAEFGSTVSYAVFHENTRNPLVEPDEDRYDTIAGEYVAEMIRESGFN